MKLSMKKVVAMATLFTAVATSASYATATLASINSNITIAASDWDSILDSYEKYVNNYIAVMEKIKAGDMSAMQESASLLESANSLSKKLENAKEDLTPEQMTRYVKIISKMTAAMM